MALWSQSGPTHRTWLTALALKPRMVTSSSSGAKIRVLSRQHRAGLGALRALVWFLGLVEGGSSVLGSLSLRIMIILEKWDLAGSPLYLSLCNLTGEEGRRPAARGE
jgi:hypothetical protein